MAGATGANGWGMRGHEHAVAALRHALASGRLAHVYLFSGPPGVGKATLARRLAAVLACEADDRPCLQCRPCRQIEADGFSDVERIAVGGVCDQRSHDHATDGSTRIRICQVRRLERVASLAPFQSARRIFIIDTLDELQPEAGHALLKTLEEPPPAVLLVLLAADPEALLPTIRSRCQEIVLRPMVAVELAAALEEDSTLPAAEAEELARLARGRYGLAMQLCQDPSLQVLRESATADVRRLSRGGRNERFDYAERLARSWQRERESVLTTLDVWCSWWRDVLLATVGVRTSEGATDEVTGIADDAAACTPAQALRALQATQRARDHLLENTNAQLALEVMMLDLPVLAGERAGEIAGQDTHAVAAPTG